MASPLAISVTADLSGLSRGMSDAAALAKSGGGAIEAAFQNVRKGAEGATDGLAAFAREQRSQDRVFGWYVRQLGEMTGATKGVQSAMVGVSGVIADLATGSVVGALVGGIGLAVAAWKSMGAASSEAGETAKAKTIELTELLVKQREELERIMFLQRQDLGGAGGTARMYEVEQQRRSKQPRLDELNEAIQGTEARISAGGTEDQKALAESGFGFNSKSGLEATINKDREALGKLYEERAAILRDLRAAEMNAVKADNAEMAKKLAEDHDREDEQDQKRKEAEVKRLQEHLKKLDAEYAAFEARRAASYGFGSQGDILEAQRAAQFGKIPSDQKNQNVEDMVGQYGVSIRPKPTFKSPEVMEAEERAKREHEQSLKRIKDQQAAYQQLGRTAGRALGDIVTGHKSVGETARDLTKQALAMGAKWALTAIMNAALRGGAEGAASSAEGGPPGVIAAPGVMAAMIAMISGLAGSVISAHSGADFAGFPTEFPMLGRSGEMMLPPEDAATMRSLRKVHVDGDGQRAPVINIRANDVKSFFDYMESNPREFDRRVGRMVRSGGIR